ncbi:MAG: glycosyltransferase family 4 protein [Pseudooceanicola sp.]|nr:glycosyltransferase family 4 protein [Pseudooceanicola sp.]
MTDALPRLPDLRVIAPNFKRRLSGVTATIVRLVPLQARMIGIAVVGPGLPVALPRLPLWRLLFLDAQTRVWHARRNTEMLAGLVLKHLFRKRLRLLFTSASQRVHTGYTRWLIGRMDRVVATSARTAEYLERPADVVMHGIDTDGFSPAGDRGALRARLGLPDGVLVGCYGRIRHQKGTDAFVEAMMAVARPGVTALVMGRATGEHEGFLRDLRAKVREAGMEDRIRFLPEVTVSEMADWYRVLDLYVAPQRWEGFGLTPLEAMACGVPVVATDVGAFPELVPDDAGRIVAAGDVAAMAAAVAAYLDSEALRGQQGAAARAHVLAHFRLEQEAGRLVEIYREMLA